MLTISILPLFGPTENSRCCGDTNQVPSTHKKVRPFFLLGLIISIGICNRLGKRRLIIIWWCVCEGLSSVMGGGLLPARFILTIWLETPRYLRLFKRWKGNPATWRRKPDLRNKTRRNYSIISWRWITGFRQSQKSHSWAKGCPIGGFSWGRRRKSSLKDCVTTP